MITDESEMLQNRLLGATQSIWSNEILALSIQEGVKLYQVSCVAAISVARVIVDGVP